MHLLLRKFPIAAVLLAQGVLLAQQQTPPQPGQTQPRQTVPPQDRLPDTVNAPPFTIQNKFQYRIVQTLEFRAYGAALVGAAIGQANGSPWEWGGGVEGFAKRYVSGVAGNLSRQTFAFAVEAVTHEDPRYFPSESKGFKARSLNAVRQIIYCKTDSGRSSLAYGRMISSFGNGQFVNVWQPASTGTVADGVKRGFYSLGVDAAYNFMQEFIPFTRPGSLRHRH